MVADRSPHPDRPATLGGADRGVGAGFAVTRRGYDPVEVETYLRRRDAETQILAADRDAVMEQSRQLTVELEGCRARVERLRQRVTDLSGPGHRVVTASERIRTMLRLVEDDVAELPDLIGAGWQDPGGDKGQAVGHCAESMRATARAAAAAVDAERIRLAAELETARRGDTDRISVALAAVEAERVRVHAELETARREETDRTSAALAALEVERGRVCAELRTAREVNADQIARATAMAEAQRTQLWADTTERCAQVEQDFQLAMDSRRSAALALLAGEREHHRRVTAELHAAAAQQAHRMIDEARSTTNHIVDQGRREIGELHAQRQRLTTQLDGARQELETILTRLAPPPEGHTPTLTLAPAAFPDHPGPETPRPSPGDS